MINVLVVDDDLNSAESHVALLSSLGYCCSFETSPMQAVERIEKDDSIDLLLLDLVMPGLSGLEVLFRAKQHRPELGIIVATILADIEKAIAAVKSGAFAYLLKPLSSEELGRSVENFCSSREKIADSSFLQNGFISDSSLIADMFQELYYLEEQCDRIVLAGEPGTGMSKIVEVFLRTAPRGPRTFKRFDANTLPPFNVLTTLFGVSGSDPTTGEAGIPGVVDAMKEDYLVLSGIEKIDSQKQEAIATLLLDRAYSALSSGKVVNFQRGIILLIDETFINWHPDAPISNAVEKLSPGLVKVPPLRERGKHDIAQLARYFLIKYAAQYQKVIKDISAAALTELYNYKFPNNVAELEKIIGMACIVEDSGVLQKSSLPSFISEARYEEELNLEELKFLAVRRAMRESDGNQTVAARKLGIARGSLNRLIGEYRKRGRNI